MSRYTASSAVLAFLSFLLLCSSAHASAPAPVHSPGAQTDLICHTSHASECYPAIFSPTEYFQRIHDDQSIPPGLHVRLNLATGLKEARLNVPEPDDAPKADIVLIDNSSPLIAEEGDGALTDGPDVYRGDRGDEPLGSEIYDQSSPERYDTQLDGPLPSEPYDEADDFTFSIHKLQDTKSDTATILSTLSTLTDIAHSLDYGITLARSSIIVNTLLGYISPSLEIPLEIRSAATQLLGTAIQNNPEALTALLSHFSETTTNRNLTPIVIVHSALKFTSPPQIAFQKRLIFLLSQLSHDTPREENAGQLQIYVAQSGLDTLWEIFDAVHMEPGLDGKDKLRLKIANYLQDHILPLIDSWPGESLLENLSPSVSTSILESQKVWRQAYKDMSFWCQSLPLAKRKYNANAEAGSVSDEESEAFLGVSEAYEMLEQVLHAHGCEGGCECDFSKTFSKS